MISVFLAERRATIRHRIDFGGAILLVVGIGGIILAADRWRYIGAIGVLLSVAMGVAALVALFVHERRTLQPMLPLGLWHNRMIVVGGLGAFAVGAAIMSVLAFLPVFIQAVMGRSAGQAGVVMAIMLVVWTFGSIAGGRLMVHISYRAICCCGAIAITGGAVILAALTPDASLAHAACGVSVLGLGLGFCNTTWIVSVQTQVAYEQRGSATSAVLFMRFLGQALGAAFAGVILSFALLYAVPELADPLGGLLDVHPASGFDRIGLARSVSHAFRGVFVLTAIMGIVTVGLALQLPRGVGAGFSRGNKPA
jgi:predicted MFS family arabinose efflux permease